MRTLVGVRELGEVPTGGGGVTEVLGGEGVTVTGTTSVTVSADYLGLEQFWYGLGTDGPITWTGSVSLTGDVYATTITAGATAVVNGAGWMIHATTSVDLELSSVLHCDGNAGALGVAGTARAATSRLVAGQPGGAGQIGAGTASGNVTGSLMPSGSGRGGAGGAGSSGGGGAAGTITSLVETRGSTDITQLPVYAHIFTAAGAFVTPTLGTGGGGGGGSGVAVGGGGGGAAGMVGIVAPVLRGAGTINVRGGAGAAGTATGCGGGGGGGGGLFFHIGRTYDFDGLVDVTGGIGGASGGGAGVAGSNGQAGVIRIMAREI